MAKLLSQLKDQANSVYKGLTSAIAPPRCFHCLREGTWLCVACQSKINVTFPLSCIGCNKLSSRGHICPSCSSGYALTGVLYGGSYQSPWLKRGITWFKFKGVRSVGPELSRLVIPRLLNIAPLSRLIDTAQLIPIPLHRSRLRQRGFNQSLDIANALTDLTTIPAADVLVRQRATWAQAKLPHELRAQNLADAFALSPKIKLSPIAIIVDDVTTTGATLNAAAKVLKAAGVQQCWGLTLARG